MRREGERERVASPIRRSSVSVCRAFRFSSERESTLGFQVRDPLDATTTLPPIAVSQTNSAALLFEFETPAAAAGGNKVGYR